jgi:2-polyprenyl-3-methyl-5-hydroxy-6-metoxy-1,4-benzoquinol methylase
VTLATHGTDTCRPSFTGERVPDDDPHFRVDLGRHLAAYHLARRYTSGKHVLDAGCGEGYGAALLADVAASVVAVDRDLTVLARARARRARSNVRFVCADLTRFGALRARFDVVCNFQVIEHLADPTALLHEFREHLVDGGLLILTTPNQETWFGESPYHVREYTAEELAALLRPIFSSVEVRGVMGNASVLAHTAARRRQVERVLRLDPLGLRHRLPAPIVRFAFARLARLVRVLVGRTDRAYGSIGPEDFVEQETADGALDLLALCRR